MPPKTSADYIATGHYVRRADVDGKSQLLRGLDGNKDQSYFLYTLSHEQIAQSLFPVGELEKPQVRKIAEELDLITAKKKIPPASALSASVNSAISWPLSAGAAGKILTVDGEEIGTHQGLMYHTTASVKGWVSAAPKRVAKIHGTWSIKTLRIIFLSSPGP